VDPLELKIHRWLSKEIGVPIERISRTSTAQANYGRRPGRGGT
jgi:hypothetical protein